MGRNHHCGGCNLRTTISSRSSHVLLREGTAPRGAPRGLSAPDRPDAGRLISRQVGCRGLAHRVHGPVWGQEGGRAVMIPLPHQARLLLTGTTGHRHGERGGIIPVSRVKAAWTGEARACAQKRKRLLGICPFPCPDADLWAPPSVGWAVSLGQKSLETQWQGCPGSNKVGVGAFSALGATALSPPGWWYTCPPCGGFPRTAQELWGPDVGK